MPTLSRQKQAGVELAEKKMYSPFPPSMWLSCFGTPVFLRGEFSGGALRSHLQRRVDTIRWRVVFIWLCASRSASFRFSATVFAAALDRHLSADPSSDRWYSVASEVA